jgi:RNA polymerase sporulation-specific sigma factor
MVDNLFSESIFDSNVLNKSLEELKDEELVMLAKKGNAKAISILINKYKNFVGSRSKSYFIVGADREDIIQEGLIGIVNAIKDYDPERKINFSSFVKLTIIRRLSKKIRDYNRQKYFILNNYISLDKPLINENNKKIEVIDSKSNIEENYINKEVIEKVKEKLTNLELNIFNEYLNDISYKEISQKLNISPKSIDNAIKRIKNKIKELVEL